MSWDSHNSDNDFIIPDEVEPHAAQKASATGTQTAANTTPAPGQSSSFWAPTVDLSSAFTPFLKSNTFQQSNKISERRFSGGNTLDEPVLDTLKRDLAQIGRRVAVVVWPAQLQQLAKSQQNRLLDLASQNGIRLPESISRSARTVPDDYADEASSPEDVATLDWDLWGPLIFSLAYASTMGVAAPKNQANVVFSGSFTFMWIFYFVAGLNIQLLRGSISFLSAISATGYSMFPIVAGALICTILISWRILRLAVMVLCALWSVYAASMSLKCSGVLPGRVFLAIYPVLLMYAVLAWLVVIT